MAGGHDHRNPHAGLVTPLHTREWGTGEHVAVLLHGLQSDSRGWWRVGPALAGRGYRVIAVDLPGHGRSPAGPATPESFAESLLDSVPPQPELALGHSLGALTLAAAVERLMPHRAIYVDPPFAPHGAFADYDRTRAAFIARKNSTRAELEASRPRWTPGDIAVELETLKDWDLDAALRLVAGLRSPDLTPPVVVPSLVVRADPSRAVPDESARALETAGFEVRTVTDSGHTIHFERFHEFMAALTGWIRPVSQ
jgi:pimeloyl-ACP methyl ester carboxylesterase